MIARLLLAGFSVFLASGASAQISMVGEHPGAVVALRSLSSGTYYIDWQTVTGSTRKIYAQDLSVHRVLTIPSAPAGMQWGVMSYVTEALFDSDPSTIEFLVQATAQGPGPGAIFIYREDGTELFSQVPGSLVGFGGGLNDNAPVFVVDGQAYLVLHSGIGPAGPTAPTRIYSLPGTLPCLDCYGSPTSGLGMDVGSEVDAFAGMGLHPNPAQSEVLVTFSQAVALVDVVVVLDASGREVMRQRSIGTGVTLQVSQLAVGAYTVFGMRGSERVCSQPLVVTR